MKTNDDDILCGFLIKSQNYYSVVPWNYRTRMQEGCKLKSYLLRPCCGHHHHDHTALQTQYVKLQSFLFHVSHFFFLHHYVTTLNSVNVKSNITKSTKSELVRDSQIKCIKVFKTILWVVLMWCGQWVKRGINPLDTQLGPSHMQVITHTHTQLHQEIWCVRVNLTAQLRAVMII